MKTIVGMMEYLSALIIVDSDRSWNDERFSSPGRLRWQGHGSQNETCKEGNGNRLSMRRIRAE